MSCADGVLYYTQKCKTKGGETKNKGRERIPAGSRVTEIENVKPAIVTEGEEARDDVYVVAVRRMSCANICDMYVYIYMRTNK